jgi:hypothetical protein
LLRLSPGAADFESGLDDVECDIFDTIRDPHVAARLIKVRTCRLK